MTYVELERAKLELATAVEILRVFAFVADMERLAEPGSSVMINVDHCRDAKRFIGLVKTSLPTSATDKIGKAIELADQMMAEISDFLAPGDIPQAPPGNIQAGSVSGSIPLEEYSKILRKGMDGCCPDCGRRKARNADDAAIGDCPKWWAIRDAAAEADCDTYRRKHWRSIAEVLNKTARVGNVVFQAGISTAAVIEAAQRLYETEEKADTFVPLHQFVDEIIDSVRKGVGLSYEEMMDNSVEYLPDGSFCVKPRGDGEGKG